MAFAASVLRCAEAAPEGRDTARRRVHDKCGRCNFGRPGAGISRVKRGGKTTVIEIESTGNADVDTKHCAPA